MFLDFIVKYWLEFVLGAVALYLTRTAKRFYNLRKLEKDQAQEVFKNEILDTINLKLEHEEENLKQTDKELKNAIQENNKMISILTEGVLSLQGKEFIKMCEDLLQPNHIITLDEYDDCFREHEIYNKLKGNHKGDLLFNLVEEKFKEQ